MPSVQRFRQFFKERLAAAAEEIFSAFEKTILEYEEEIIRQRKLLDIAWKPAVKLPRIELPQQLPCKEEEVVAIDHQLIHQERNSRLDQQGPELPQVKEELCTSQDREYLVLKQETDTFMVPHTYEKGGNTGHPTLSLNLSESESLAEKEPLVKISIKTPEEAELNTNHQFFSHSSCLSKSHEIEGKPGNAETKPQKIPLKGNYVHNPAMLMNYCETHATQKSFKCDTCGKTFPFNSKLIRHLRIHTGVRPYSCNICGKRFNQKSILDAHVRIHTGEKPFSCKTCGKCLRSRSSLLVHMKTHRGEQPYSCERWDVSGVTIL